MSGLVGAEDGAGAAVRTLLRAADRATLATVERAGSPGGRPGAPHASLVLLAVAQDASPLLLVSDLAEHTMNLRADDRVSLLIDGTAGLDDPLTGPRASVQGRASVSTDAALEARFLARHPGAADYAGFADFHLFRVTIQAAHLVAGFGRIRWASGDAVRSAAADAASLAVLEPDILAHMNQDHADAVRRYATALLGLPDGAWRMTGIDPDGADLRLGGRVGRLAFTEPVRDAETARAVLAALARRAKAAAGGASGRAGAGTFTHREC